MSRGEFQLRMGLTPLFLQRSHLLSQSQVFDDKVRSAPAHRPDRARAERDEEYENTEHGGGVCLFRSLISSGSSPCDRGEEGG